MAMHIELMRLNNYDTTNIILLVVSQHPFKRTCLALVIVGVADKTQSNQIKRLTVNHALSYKASRKLNITAAVPQLNNYARMPSSSGQPTNIASGNAIPAGYNSGFGQYGTGADARNGQQTHAPANYAPVSASREPAPPLPQKYTANAAPIVPSMSRNPGPATPPPRYTVFVPADAYPSLKAMEQQQATRAASIALTNAHRNHVGGIRLQICQISSSTSTPFQLTYDLREAGMTGEVLAKHNRAMKNAYKDNGMSPAEIAGWVVLAPLSLFQSVWCCLIREKCFIFPNQQKAIVAACQEASEELNVLGIPASYNFEIANDTWNIYLR